MTLDKTAQIGLYMQHKVVNAECMESNASGKAQINEFKTKH